MTQAHLAASALGKRTARTATTPSNPAKVILVIHALQIIPRPVWYDEWERKFLKGMRRESKKPATSIEGLEALRQDVSEGTAWKSG